MRKLLTILFILVITNVSVYAQVEGHANIEGGYDFNTNHMENVDFLLKYNKKEKYYIGTSLRFMHNFNSNHDETDILEFGDPDEYAYKTETSYKGTRQYDARGSVLFGFLPNSLNSIDFNVGYNYSRRRDNPYVLMNILKLTTSSNYEMYQKDTSVLDNQGIDYNIAYNRKYRNRSSAHFSMDLSGSYFGKDDNITRITRVEGLMAGKHYRTFRNTEALRNLFSIKYQDIIDKKHPINYSTGLDFITNMDNDLYRAENYYNGQWHDSIQYHQKYSYINLRTEPYFCISQNFEKFGYSIDERLQYNFRSLKDQMDEHSVVGDTIHKMFTNELNNILSVHFNFIPNKTHSFNVGFSQSINQVDYRRLCPTLTFAGNEGEYNRGNPNLKPEKNYKVNFKYLYSTVLCNIGLELNYTYKTDLIERVLDVSFSKQDSVVKMLYTYINTKTNQNFGGKVYLEVSAGWFRSRLWGNLFYDIYNYSSVDFSYQLGLDMFVMITPTFKINVDATYYSEKTTAYNYHGEDVVGNIKVTKEFKKFSAFLEMRNVIDAPIINNTWDQTATYLKTTQSYRNRRLCILGLSYRF